MLIDSKVLSLDANLLDRLSINLPWLSTNSLKGGWLVLL